MNPVVEKLAAIEKEVTAIQPKMTPLTERIADIDQKVAGFAQQLAGIAEESAAVKQDIELTLQSLARIRTLIGESKTESEQLVAGQEENLQRCETMTAVFGAAFQAMSQFFETAQRMGLADQAKAVFLSPSSTPATLTLPPAFTAPPDPPVIPPAPLESAPPIPQPVAETVPPAKPPVIESPVSPPSAETAPVEVPPMKPPVPEPASELPPEIPAKPAIEKEPVIEKPLAAEPVHDDDRESIPSAKESKSALPEPPVPEPPVMNASVVDLPAVEPPATESPAESVLSASDFDTATSDTAEKESSSWSVPGLPDVVTPPDIAHSDFDSADSDTDAEPPGEMASQLDVPPLNLSAPALPEQSESVPANDMDDQDIEDMLASMMTPVTAAAGS